MIVPLQKKVERKNKIMRKEKMNKRNSLIHLDFYQVGMSLKAKLKEKVEKKDKNKLT